MRYMLVGVLVEVVGVLAHAERLADLNGHGITWVRIDIFLNTRKAVGMGFIFLVCQLV